MIRSKSLYDPIFKMLFAHVILNEIFVPLFHPKHGYLKKFHISACFFKNIILNNVVQYLECDDTLCSNKNGFKGTFKKIAEWHEHCPYKHPEK